MKKGHLRSVPRPRSEGIAPPTYTQVPDEILDGLGDRPYTETLVLLYICRRTFGFRRDADAISYDQFIHGIKKRDGTRLDTGCGIKNRSTLSTTIKSLEQQGLIEVGRGERDNVKQTTTYRLRLRADGVVQQADHPEEGGSTAAGLRVVRQLDQGVVQLLDLQQTVDQQTVDNRQEPPGPRKRGSTGSPPIIEEVAQPDHPTPTVGTEASPPPTPSPAALEAAEQRILDAGRRLDRQSSVRGNDNNGWAERPDDLERLKARLWEKWRGVNPTRVARKDLARVATSVAPDEVEAFRRQTDAHLRANADGEFVMGLKRWLEEWRDWVGPKAGPPAPRTMAEAMALKSRQHAIRKEA
jgi:hypothetical protein